MRDRARQWFMIHIINTLALSLLGLTSVAQALDKDDIKVPFVFTEDATLPQSDLHASVPHSDAIRDDKFLNNPMTRLEYMLSKLEAALAAESTKAYIHSQLKEAFDPTPDGFSVSPYARYNAQLGRIFVGFNIDNLGKPKSPLKRTCGNLLIIMKVLAPQEPLGFLYHNTILGVLAQKPYDEYTPPLDVLAKSVVHVARLQSETDNKTTIHSLTCQRNGENTPLVYYRFSFSLK